MDRKANDIYVLTEAREINLWKDCIFIFDSSALLDLYYYPEITRKDIYEQIFETQQSRIWIPNHVQFEYLKNRESVIQKPITENYKPLVNDYLTPIVGTTKTLEEKIKSLKEATKKKETHPFIDNSLIVEFEKKIIQYTDIIKEFDKNYKTQIEIREKEILQLQNKDTVLENIEKYFTVGREYSFNEIIEITKEGKHRYEFNIPPGYQDLKKEKKDGTQIFGDLIIWKQILEYAKEKNKSVIFICNDVKEDWCITEKETKRIKTPREELIKEFKDFTGKEFWMYNQLQFIYTANKLLKTEIKEEQIEQISEFISTKSVNDFLNNYQTYSFEEKLKNISTFSLDEISRTVKFISIIDRSEANKMLLLLYNNELLQQKIIDSDIQNIGGALSNFKSIDPILADNIYQEIENNVLIDKFKKASIPKLKSAIGELNNVNETKTKEILSSIDIFEKFNYERLSLKQLVVLFNDIDIENSKEKLKQIPNSFFEQKLIRERMNDIGPTLAKLFTIDPIRTKELYRSIPAENMADKFSYETIDRVGQNLSILNKVDNQKTKEILNILSTKLIPINLLKCKFRDFCSVLLELKPIDNNTTSKIIFNSLKKQNIFEKIANASFKEICNGLVKLNKVNSAKTKQILNDIDLKIISDKLSIEKPKFEEIANALLNLKNIDKDMVVEIFKISSFKTKATEIALDTTSSSEQSFLTSIFIFLETDFNFGKEILGKVPREFINHVLDFSNTYKFSAKFPLLKKAFLANNLGDEIIKLDKIKIK